MPKKNWRVELSKYALKSLKKFGKKTAQKILISLEELEKMENPLLHKDIRSLTGKLRGFYRLKVADFRVIFELDRKNRRIGVHIIIYRGSAY